MPFLKILGDFWLILIRKFEKSSNLDKNQAFLREPKNSQFF